MTSQYYNVLLLQILLLAQKRRVTFQDIVRPPMDEVSFADVMSVQ